MMLLIYYICVFVGFVDVCIVNNDNRRKIKIKIFTSYTTETTTREREWEKRVPASDRK
jgi:hypothetical protein